MNLADVRDACFNSSKRLPLKLKSGRLEYFVYLITAERAAGLNLWLFPSLPLLSSAEKKKKKKKEQPDGKADLHNRERGLGRLLIFLVIPVKYASGNHTTKAVIASR